jgi:hypothetical protein
MRAFWIALSVVLIGAGSAFTYEFWPRKLIITPRPVLPAVQWVGRRAVVYWPNRVLVGELAEFDDDLFAYLMFDHYRAVPLLSEMQLLLISEERGGKPVYRISVHLPADLLDGVSLLAKMQMANLTSALQYDWITQSDLMRDLHETTLFLNAYREPTATRLEQLHPDELQNYLRRFLRFKSLTDPRIHKALEIVPSPLSGDAAGRLAADIIAVSDFYELPLDLFIGIGAMENNYMDVPGDLNNTAWKKRADPGDIVLRRHRGRVLVLNDSTGIWQITKQSLRYAHRLYRSDKRDYTRLPERLRPPEALDVLNVNPETLTTYAGLLLKNLLDRFHGDIEKAAGAYNGGVDNPNLQYAAGVQIVAAYARTVIERTASLHSAAVSQRRLLGGVEVEPVPPDPDQDVSPRASGQQSADDQK